MEEEDVEAECIVNRIQWEMAAVITWEEVERVTSQDSTLQAVMEDIKKGCQSVKFGFLAAPGV